VCDLGPDPPSDPATDGNKQHGQPHSENKESKRASVTITVQPLDSQDAPARPNERDHKIDGAAATDIAGIDNGDEWAAQLLIAADRFQIPDLVDHCTAWLIGTLTLRNAAQRYALGSTCNIPALQVSTRGPFVFVLQFFGGDGPETARLNVPHRTTVCYV
jgi:hypothetical protein